MVGEYLFGDYDFIKNLAKDRNTFQKVWDEIKHLAKLATAGSKEARELEKVKRMFEKAYQEMQTEAKVETSYSLDQDLTNSDRNDIIDLYTSTDDFIKEVAY